MLCLLVLSVLSEIVPATQDAGNSPHLPEISAPGGEFKPDPARLPNLEPAVARDEFTILYQFTRVNRGNRVAEAHDLPIRLAKLSYEGRFGFTKHNRKNHSGLLPPTAILDRAALKIIEEGEKIPVRYTILDIELWKTSRKHQRSRRATEFAEIPASCP